MKKLIIPVLALALKAAVISAQADLPSNYFMTKLGNGLDVLVVEDKSVPIATIEINVKNGSYTEPAEFSGLSHFYEHMFFKANKDIPSQEEYIKKSNVLGMAWNGTTSVNRVNYFFTLPSKNLDEGLNFMNSAIRYPLFLESEMKNEQPVVNGEFQRNESNPEFGLYYEWNKKMWGKDVSRKVPIGDHDVILSATTEKMQAIQHKYYRPNNSLLIVSGDVNHADIFEKVKNIFGDWEPSGFDPFKKWPVPEFKPIKEDISFITTSENASSPVIYIGWHGPDTRTDINATYVADVFSYIINLETSKFSKELIDGGLALESYLGYSTDIYTGPIQLRIVPNPQKIKECLQMVEKHISMWDSKSYFTDEQIETAKNKLAIEGEYGREQTSSYGHTLGFWWAVDGIDYAVNYTGNLRKVTRDDLEKYARKYIVGKPKVSGLLLSPSARQTLGIKKFNDLLN